jgi:P4 family phage/plasmid primase-like protien
VTKTKAPTKIAKSGGGSGETTKAPTKSKKLAAFLNSHYNNGGDDDDDKMTNTKIKNKKLNISGGNYTIEPHEYLKFLHLHYDEHIATGVESYYTEKQLDKGVIAVDVDLRFDGNVRERLLTDDHIQDLVDLYLAIFKKMYYLDEDTAFPIYIYQKPEINYVEEDNKTKDGVHILFGMQADRQTQLFIRTQVMKEIGDIWADLPITNTWDEVFDHGICAGTANWQLHGSKKPGFGQYELIRAYNVTYPGGFELDRIDLATFDVRANIYKLSARYPEHYDPFMRNEYLQKIQEASETAITPSSGGLRRTGSSFNVVPVMLSYSNEDVIRIMTAEQLEQMKTVFLESLTQSDHDLREIYEYTMCLPPAYYEAGSYNKWFLVGCALRNMSDRLFIVWVIFSAQAANFDYGGIAEMYEKWLSFYTMNPQGLTKRSIMLWAKKDAPEQYAKVHENSIDYFIERTLEVKMALDDADGRKRKPNGCGDFDLAMVLYQMKKDEYVCPSVKAGVWYRFKGNRWIENDSGTTLRRAISEDMRFLYIKKQDQLAEAKANYSSEQENYEKIMVSLGAKIDRAGEIIARLARTNDKKNIMTEAKELFYDGRFFQELDTNPYLLCFSNGVWDFRTGEFRDGKPEDYISKCTNTEYRPIEPERDQAIVDDIHDFMYKLFPVEELRNYMWEHLASVLIGTLPNQTFNNYIGCGRNGKSVLVTLMQKILGEYHKGDVPISLITQGRTKIGGTAIEIVQLKGIRYAVMQEPSKDETINEGMMKQLTSGLDEISARAPYGIDIVRFFPQFKLIVCANYLLPIKSQDDGTWRRIRVVDFMSKFTENPVSDDPDRPYQFLVDHDIIAKFDQWKYVFMAMLVEIALKTKGYVKDCDTVLSSSNAYKANQDVMSEFIREYIVAAPGKYLVKKTINEAFVAWHMSTYGTKGHAKELHAYMDKQYGKATLKGWANVDIYRETSSYDDDNSEIDADEPAI